MENSLATLDTPTTGQAVCPLPKEPINLDALITNRLLLERIDEALWRWQRQGVPRRNRLLVVRRQVQ